MYYNNNMNDELILKSKEMIRKITTGKPLKVLKEYDNKTLMLVDGKPFVCCDWPEKFTVWIVIKNENGSSS